MHAASSATPGPTPALAAAKIATGLVDTPVITGLTNPTNFRFSPDGRVFVAQKNGKIFEYDSLTDTTPTLFADLSAKVDDYWDRGLLGLALDPNFPASPYIYALYTYDAPIGGTPPVWNDACPTPPGPTTDGCVVSGRLVRLTASGNVMTGSEQVLLSGWCQQFPSHSIGDLQFGPDGALYVSGGDGASFNYADYGQAGGTLNGTQTPKNPCGDPPGGVGGTMSPPTAEGGSLRSQSIRRPAGQPVLLNGAILRVDPATGAALPNNPNIGAADANARRIVAYGMRNPFRFTFRPGTGEIWLGDVGQDTWEEIDRLPSPTTNVLNFGWPCYEGVSPMPAFQSLNLDLCSTLYSAGSATAPYYTYKHQVSVVTGDGCPTGSSSTSGVSFYTGSSYPAMYKNALFFGDYARACIWAMLPGANGLPDPSNIKLVEQGGPGPVDFEVGPNGDIYYADLSGGTIRRLSSSTAAPIASATASPIAGPLPLTVTFDASASTGPAGDPLSYSWDLNGDGVFGDATGVTVQRTYTAPAAFDARVRVTDTVTGQNDTSAPIRITPGDTAPVPSIASPSSSVTWAVGDTISFSGSATDAEDGPIPASGLQWDEILHHCAADGVTCHTHQIQTFAGVASGSFVAPDHGYPSWLEVRLTATDSFGAKAVTSVRLDPKTTTITVQSSPSGLQLGIADAVGTTPFTKTVIQGSTDALTAPDPQLLSNVTQRFRSWSDGGATTHNVIAGTTPATYTATYASDLAQSHPATASSSESASLGPQFAVDGSSSSRWGSLFTDNQWWQVDLGSVRSIDTVALNWETAYGKTYKIQVSSDGSTFADAASVTNTSSGWKITTFTPVNARYVRMLGLTRGTQWGYSLWDAQVFGPPAGGGGGSPPANTALPVVTGLAGQGQTLSTTNGTWTNTPTGFAYQWKRCDSGGANCVAIASATAATYTLTAADVGSTVVASVTASNAVGAATASSAATTVVRADFALGQPATASSTDTGTAAAWAVDGNSTTRWSSTFVDNQWWQVDLGSVKTVDTVVLNWEAAYASTYKIQVSTDGSTFTDAATVSNAASGWKVATFAPATGRYLRVLGVTRATQWGISFWDAQVFGSSSGGGSPPVNTALPALSGSATQGQTLTTTNGAWSNSPTSFAYQWLRCDTNTANCVAIASATASTYTLVAADVGSRIVSSVTASNASGSATAASAATAVVAGLPPANTGLPVVSGTPTQGSTLSTTNGTWSNNPTAFAYQWKRCDTNGANCVAIASATASTYTLVVADVGSRIVVSVTASNAFGSTTATSAATAVVTGLPPVNTAVPVVTGTATQGQTLSTTNGTWSNSPTSFAYQWKRCDTNGANCVAIASATASTYTLVAADVGSRIVSSVTATNASGSATASSAATAVVAAAAGSAPVNTAAPAVSGYAGQGQTLSTSNGAWSNSPTSFGYQWKRCDVNGANCIAIASATAATYKLAGADVGATVVASVTATNASGSSAATSVATAVVRGDLALGLSTTSSSNDTGTLPQYAVDGSSSTRWSSTYVDNQWWQVDLGAVKTVDTVALNWEAAYASSYKIQVSSDGTVFTDAATVSNGATGWKLTSFAAVSGRYLRVLGVTRATQWGISFWDAQVFGPAGGGGGTPPTNTALPTVSGFPGQGQTLTAGNGAWSNSPTSFAYQWLRCDSGGASCVAIASATASTYTLAAADAGSTVAVSVTASNASGSAAAASTATSLVKADQALGGAATASTSETGLTPGLAVDGSSSTRWGSTFVDNQWWQVDLGSVKSVSTVALNWETAYASSYKVQVSTDGTTFTDAATVSIGASGWKLATFTAVSARYVRVLGVTRATQWGISFWDAQVF